MALMMLATATTELIGALGGSVIALAAVLGFAALCLR